jgi:hypothetical protein
MEKRMLTNINKNEAEETKAEAGRQVVQPFETIN